MKTLQVKPVSKKTHLSVLAHLFPIVLLLALLAMTNCKKKDSLPAEQPACYNADKVRAAFKKVKDFLAANEAAYKNGTIENSKIGLYIDMLATYERMDYFINIITLGPGIKVTNDDGSQFTIDELLVMNYKEALCNETDDVNKKL
jgi:hypothetical protein